MTIDHLDTVVRGGRVVRPSGVTEADIAIADGKIVAVGSADLFPEAVNYVEAVGKYVLPGAVDVHTHVYLDSYRTISESAAFGGVTTLLSYIWPDQSMDIPGSIEQWRNFGESASVVDFGLHVGLIDTPTSLQQISKAAEIGVVSFKMMMAYKRRGLMVSDEFMMAAMERVARVGGLVSVHCESGGIVSYLEQKMMAAGLSSPTDYPNSRPPEAEIDAIQRAITIADLTQCPLYIVHLTTGAGMEIVADAKLLGQPVWAETCPHYLFLTREEFERQGPLVKIAPPLRGEEDCEALWAGIESGTISTVASDHTAYTREMKSVGWTDIYQAPYGIPGTETMLPLVYTEGVMKRGLPITALPKLLSENPAKLFGLYPQKGAIEVGSDADLVLLDPDKEVTVTASGLHTRADFTPFEGRKVQGWPETVMVRGQLVVKEGELVCNPPHGQFLRREPSSLIPI